MAIQLISGDITRAEVDAIVNAANPGLLGGGGVDGAIHRAAGPELLAECQAIPVSGGVRCPIGESRVTQAGKLKAQFVIHTVGPRYQVDPEPARLLRSAYVSCLKLALEKNCRSIAFPAISCGVYSYPLDEAAGIAVSVCTEEHWDSLDIRFYLPGRQAYDSWANALLC